MSDAVQVAMNGVSLHFINVVRSCRSLNWSQLIDTITVCGVPMMMTTCYLCLSCASMSRAVWLLLLTAQRRHAAVPADSRHRQPLTLTLTIVKTGTVMSKRQLTSRHRNSYVTAVAGRKMHFKHLLIIWWICARRAKQLKLVDCSGSYNVLPPDRHWWYF